MTTLTSSRKQLIKDIRKYLKDEEKHNGVTDTYDPDTVEGYGNTLLAQCLAALKELIK